MLQLLQVKPLSDHMLSEVQSIESPGEEILSNLAQLHSHLSNYISNLTHKLLKKQNPNL